MEESQSLVALAALLQLLSKSNRSSLEYSQLVDYASQLIETPTTAKAVEAVAKKFDMNLESLGLNQHKNAHIAGDIGRELQVCYTNNATSSPHHTRHDQATLFGNICSMKRQLICKVKW